MTAARRPSASSTDRRKWVVVVLPLVPVTPTTARRRDGWPWKAAATGPMAARTSSTTTWGTSTWGTSTSTKRSTSRATAPAATAWAAKSWPSAVAPRTQQNSVPGHDGTRVVADGHDLGAFRVSPYGANLNVAEQPTEQHAVPMVSSRRSRA